MGYYCKNRKTKGIIERWDFKAYKNQLPVSVRQLHCKAHHVDSRIFGYREKMLCSHAQSHPWEWCGKCKELVRVLENGCLNQIKEESNL